MLAVAATFICALILAQVEVRFRVVAPAETPADAVVFVSGDAAALGSWRADGLRLVRDGDAWVGRATLPEGRFEWKATLGTWDRCEVAADGGDRPNRVDRAVEGAVVEATVARWRSGAPERRASTATGDIRTEGPIASDSTIAQRSVLVRLPRGYDDPANAERRYPVLYLLDGQNVFDAATSFAGVEWRADETVDALVDEGAIEPTIVVGIPNSPARVDELTFVAAVGDGPITAGGGRGAEMLAWIVERVKPRIDGAYRTRPGREATTLGGSSLGGLFTLEALARRGDVFGRGIAMSPSLWWAGEELLARWTEHPAQRPRPVALWIDIGTDEGRGDPAAHVARARRIGALFADDASVRLVVVDGGRHHESDWSRRLPDALRFLFGAAPTKPGAGS
jgi:predicted alpha/beta superfamily hydrolase